MDQSKIGKFIADTRKRQGMTQKQLAERINVTDKTVSKWETGYRMPDASILPELGAALQVDVNELLAGESFSSQELSREEYAQKSEHNLVELVGELNEMERKRKGGSLGVMIGTAFLGLSCAVLLFSSLRPGNVLDIFDWPTLLSLLGLKLLLLSISGWFCDYANAWKACLPGNRNLPDKELEAAMHAIRYAGSLTVGLGALIASLSLFSLLYYTDHSVSILPALAQTVLALLYTAILEIAYVILLYRMRRMLLNRKSTSLQESRGESFERM